MKERKRIRVNGVVQGVGFRPCVYRLARDLGLTGFVRNTSDGVDIEIEGKPEKIQRFTRMLQEKKPAAAVIDTLTVQSVPFRGTKTFAIRKSAQRAGFTRIAPDIATCPDCCKEFHDPDDRRYRYPFINCTNCGPRYSIIQNTPYDRAQTSMKSFRMCETCAAEFQDVSDRRFHAQPDCCTICGPIFMLDCIKGNKKIKSEPVSQAARLLKQGKLIAVKGIGGFHIACDATNSRVVKRLRSLKQRPSKPFAIMCSMTNTSQVARISREEAEQLQSPVAPIVLLRKKGNAILSEQVAPRNPYVGIMLPYTPVHYLLLEKVPYLVMTSGNIQDEPIVKDDQEVKNKLGSIVTHILTHDRKIENRCDDSVGFVFPKRGFSILRRSRGYVPNPIALPDEVPHMLALGPHLKNTFTLAHGREAYVSPHIGDLDNMETLDYFRETIQTYQRWFHIKPEYIVHDLHPEYLSTRRARDYDMPKTAVQHHIAHAVSCLGEHTVRDRAISIAFDGTGYGLDGRIWGGEFFVGDLADQRRVAHLEYLPLPGGESSIRHPYRIAVAYAAVLCDRKFKPRNVTHREVEIVHRILDDRQFVVETSSMGRLFDCVAGMIGLIREITYEAEAAITLEHIAEKKVSRSYGYTIYEGDPMRIGVAPVIKGVIHDVCRGICNETIAAKFHNTIVRFSLEVVDRISSRYRTRIVCLSGGVFQNRLLLSKMVSGLEKSGYTAYIHKKLPTNDGCISYGQVIYGNYRHRNKQSTR